MAWLWILAYWCQMTPIWSDQGQQCPDLSLWIWRCGLQPVAGCSGPGKSPRRSWRQRGWGGGVAGLRCNV